MVNTVRLPENDLQVKGIRKDMYKKGLVMKKGFMRNQGRVKRNFFSRASVPMSKQRSNQNTREGKE